MERLADGYVSSLSSKIKESSIFKPYLDIMKQFDDDIAARKHKGKKQTKLKNTGENQKKGEGNDSRESIEKTKEKKKKVKNEPWPTRKLPLSQAIKST